VSLPAKVSALILTIAMALEGTGIAQEVITVPGDFQAQVLDDKAAKAKAEVTRRGTGEKSKVRVKLRDKHEWKGHITQIDDDSFELQIDPDWLDTLPIKDRRVTIRYAKVEKIRGARPRAATVGIAIGMTVATVAILVALVVLKFDRCRRGNCS